MIKTTSQYKIKIQRFGNLWRIYKFDIKNFLIEAKSFNSEQDARDYYQQII
jgi:hypothetical protein